MWTLSTLPARAARPSSTCALYLCRRCFHDYFVTHLPSSSLHPDSRSPTGPHHKLPRDKSTPHTSSGPAGRSPASIGPSRETTVVRIPLRSAKHHFGVSVSRGTRPYNEDSYQAGTIEIPAFAKRTPISLTRSKGSSGPANTVSSGEGTSAEGASGDPQVFYFGVFDGHGGNECSDFLREQLHEYIERAAGEFELHSSLGEGTADRDVGGMSKEIDTAPVEQSSQLAEAGKEALRSIQTYTPEGVKPIKRPGPGDRFTATPGNINQDPADLNAQSIVQSENKRKAEELERALVKAWRETVGGYFKRFKPEYFSLSAGGQGHCLEREVVRGKQLSTVEGPGDEADGIGIETVLEYSFLKADFDFIAAQVGKKDEDQVLADQALNADDILESPSRVTKRIGGAKRFKGGSTCSVALISTPTPTPFWHPASPSTLVTSHVGDTRIILCDTATGQAVPLTSDHHPNTPIEAARLRRYATTFSTDSFGEERVMGLANTRAFGDMQSKRIGVSAEPEIRRIELSPAQYSFLVLISDGVSGVLSDQEVVDIVKEARTPEQAARDVVSFATEVAGEADNATALVVRLGGWERRIEGGTGSMSTKEIRDFKRDEAEMQRGRRGR